MVKTTAFGSCVVLSVLASAVLAAAAPAGAQAPQVLGNNPDACRPGAEGSAALVTVHGFKDRVGRLRVQNYRGTKEDYLVEGHYLHREEVPVTPAGDITLCLPLPGPGDYAIVALHDRDSNGRLSIWSDGIGFSRNPRLGLAKPAADHVVISFGPGVTPVRIVLNYRRGLSVRPIG
jgi:uncharacterized protein (DUF2141 family)